MIDLHCHILPFVDDGAQDIAESLALATAAVADGITHAVLTPHLHPGRWENGLASLLPRFNAFRAMLASSALPLTLSLGAEVRLLPESLTMLAQDDVPMLGAWEGERVMLLEFPHEQVPVGALNAIKWLRARGVRPLLAHPERNRDLMREPGRIDAFVEAGCLLQVTAGSVVGAFGAPAQALAKLLLDAGRVTVVASDAHNIAHRPPLMAQARAALAAGWGDELALRLTRDNPQTIVGGR